MHNLNIFNVNFFSILFCYGVHPNCIDWSSIGTVLLSCVAALYNQSRLIYLIHLLAVVKFTYAGLADLNRFQSRFKSIDFLVQKIE